MIAIQHEIIMRLHARFVKEGIEINYPVRKLSFPTTGALSIAAESFDLNGGHIGPCTSEIPDSSQDIRRESDS